MLQLEHRFWTHTAHVLYGVLVADIIGALHGIVHMPAPVVIGV